MPDTEDAWRDIAREFLEKWNFNNCIGAMDGKHVLIRPPPNSGSYYFNYKHSFSIVLLAIVDANYKFIYTDIGCNGQISDGGVFKNCNLYHALEQKNLKIPKESTLPGSNQVFPFVLVADDAFPLKDYIMKPYSQHGLTAEKRVFNYRLSRTTRIFMTPINLSPEKVETITLLLCTTQSPTYQSYCTTGVHATR